MNVLDTLIRMAGSLNDERLELKDDLRRSIQSHLQHICANEAKIKDLEAEIARFKSREQLQTALHSTFRVDANTQIRRMRAALEYYAATEIGENAATVLRNLESYRDASAG